MNTPRTSAQWCEYFRANAEDQTDIPWDAGLRITPAELTEIAESLRAWQLGETSDGAHLLNAARRYAECIGDPDFVTAIELFIQEEKRHGAMLGRFLDLAGIERKQSDWGDTLFRACRYFLPNMETWTTPVIMVETHALIYYNAIRQASNCPVLRGICVQILRDETPHIRFQCERLAIRLRDRPRWLRVFTMLLHRAFFTAMTLAIWFGHRRALKAGGLSLGQFWRAAWAKVNWAWRMMDATGESTHGMKLQPVAATQG